MNSYGRCRSTRTTSARTSGTATGSATQEPRPPFYFFLGRRPTGVRRPRDRGELDLEGGVGEIYPPEVGVVCVSADRRPAKRWRKKEDAREGPEGRLLGSAAQGDCVLLSGRCILGVQDRQRRGSKKCPIDDRTTEKKSELSTSRVLAGRAFGPMALRQPGCANTPFFRPSFFCWRRCPDAES